MAFILFSSLTLMCVFIVLLLSLFFTLSPKGARGQNVVFAVLIFFFGLQIAYSYCTSTFAYRYFLDFHKPLFILRQTSLLTGPFFYFYLRSFLDKETRYRAADLTHFIPFAFSVIFLSLYYLNLDGFVIWKSPIDLYDTIFILTHTLLYIACSSLRLIAVRSKKASALKNPRHSPGISWLIRLVLGFIAFWLVNLNTFALYMIVKKPSWCAYTASIYALVVFLAFAAMLLALLLKPEIYHHAAKYQNSRLDETSKHESLLRLNDYMREQKPYLDPYVTFDDIAGALSLNRRSLSQIINELSGGGMKRYLNEFRLRESMRLLNDDTYGEKTILDILYEAGFNSKSVFNLQFKKHTGLTPQEYRNRILKKSVD